MLCHNIDVIHIEKNVVDNIIGTLLNMENKTKDNLKARLDLKKKKKFCDLNFTQFPELQTRHISRQLVLQ
jgi:hypothetical protein